MHLTLSIMRPYVFCLHGHEVSTFRLGGCLALVTMRPSAFFLGGHLALAVVGS